MMALAALAASLRRACRVGKPDAAAAFWSVGHGWWEGMALSDNNVPGLGCPFPWHVHAA